MSTPRSHRTLVRVECHEETIAAQAQGEAVET